MIEIINKRSELKRMQYNHKRDQANELKTNLISCHLLSIKSIMKYKLNIFATKNTQKDANYTTYNFKNTRNSNCEIIKSKQQHTNN